MCLNISVSRGHHHQEICRLIMRRRTLHPHDPGTRPAQTATLPQAITSGTQTAKPVSPRRDLVVSHVELGDSSDTQLHTIGTLWITWLRDLCRCVVLIIPQNYLKKWLASSSNIRLINRILKIKRNAAKCFCIEMAHNIITTGCRDPPKRGILSFQRATSHTQREALVFQGDLENPIDIQKKNEKNANCCITVLSGAPSHRSNGFQFCIYLCLEKKFRELDLSESVLFVKRFKLFIGRNTCLVISWQKYE